MRKKKQVTYDSPGVKLPPWKDVPKFPPPPLH